MWKNSPGATGAITRVWCACHEYQPVWFVQEFSWKHLSSNAPPSEVTGNTSAVTGSRRFSIMKLSQARVFWPIVKSFFASFGSDYYVYKYFQWFLQSFCFKGVLLIFSNEFGFSMFCSIFGLIVWFSLLMEWLVFLALWGFFLYQEWHLA